MIENKTSLQSVLNDPRWLPHAIDAQSGQIRFAWIDRAGLSREPFLDDRIAPSVKRTADFAIRDVITTKISTQSQLSFIFHSAFCCSTLMARAFDLNDRVLSLREPNILMDISNQYRMAKTQQDLNLANQLLSVVLKLLSRPHGGERHVLIKPTNAANNLAEMIAPSGAPCLFLYGDLNGFLASVLKKGEACKAFMRKQYLIFSMEKAGVGQIPPRDAMALTDLQIASMVWRHQIEGFSRLLKSLKTDNVRSLDFRLFLSDRIETMNAVSRHFNFALPAADLESIAASDVFTSDSKSTGRRYDSTTRKREEDAQMADNAELLALISKWAHGVSLGGDVTLPLPKPL